LCVRIAEPLNQPNTYFTHLALLVLSGCWPDLGLTFRRWTLQIYQATFSVYLFIMRLLRAAVLFATHRASMCMGCVEWNKLLVVYKCNKSLTSIVGQCQTLLLLVVEGDEHLSSFKLLYVVVEPFYLFEYWLIMLALFFLIDTFINYFNTPCAKENTLVILLCNLVLHGNKKKFYIVIFFIRNFILSLYSN
jgi:hypothetical protein